MAKVVQDRKMARKMGTATNSLPVVTISNMVGLTLTASEQLEK